MVLTKVMLRLCFLYLIRLRLSKQLSCGFTRHQCRLIMKTPQLQIFVQDALRYQISADINRSDVMFETGERNHICSVCD